MNRAANKRTERGALRTNAPNVGDRKLCSLVLRSTQDEIGSQAAAPWACTHSKSKQKPQNKNTTRDEGNGNVNQNGSSRHTLKLQVHGLPNGLPALLTSRGTPKAGYHEPGPARGVTASRNSTEKIDISD